MSNPEEGQGEPSMEEILASIRRIISEDEPADGDGEAEAEPEAAAPEEAEAPEGEASEEATKEEPLELTEEVADEAPAAEAEAAEEPEPEPEPEPDMPEAEAPVELVAEEEDTPEVVEEPEPPAAAGDTLVEPDVAASASASIASIVGQLGAESAASPGGSMQRTLEEVVRDALMPELKSWLDRHLPGLVERIVREEIKKMVRRAEDS